eukprot:99894_1
MTMPVYSFLFVSIILATILTNVSCLSFSTTTGTSTLSGFEVDVDIDSTTTTITARIAMSQSQVWHAIGFGATKMSDNPYVIIQEFNITNPEVPDFSIRQLDRHNGPNPYPQGTELDATASLWTKFFNASSDPIIITLIRDNNVNNGEYTFDPTATTLQIIHSYGIDTLPFATSSGHAARAGLVYNNMFVSTTIQPINGEYLEYESIQCASNQQFGEITINEYMRIEFDIIINSLPTPLYEFANILTIGKDGDATSRLPAINIRSNGTYEIFYSLKSNVYNKVFVNEYTAPIGTLHHIKIDILPNYIQIEYNYNANSSIVYLPNNERIEIGNKLPVFLTANIWWPDADANVTNLKISSQSTNIPPTTSNPTNAPITAQPSQSTNAPITAQPSQSTNIPPTTSNPTNAPITAQPSQPTNAPITAQPSDPTANVNSRCTYSNDGPIEISVNNYIGQVQYPNIINEISFDVKLQLSANSCSCPTCWPAQNRQSCHIFSIGGRYPLIYTHDETFYAEFKIQIDQSNFQTSRVGTRDAYPILTDGNWHNLYFRFSFTRRTMIIDDIEYVDIQNGSFMSQSPNEGTFNNEHIQTIREISAVWGNPAGNQYIHTGTIKNICINAKVSGYRDSFSDTNITDITNYWIKRKKLDVEPRWMEYLDDLFYTSTTNQQFKIPPTAYYNNILYFIGYDYKIHFTEILIDDIIHNINVYNEAYTPLKLNWQYDSDSLKYLEFFKEWGENPNLIRDNSQYWVQSDNMFHIWFAKLYLVSIDLNHFGSTGDNDESTVIEQKFTSNGWLSADNITSLCMSTNKTHLFLVTKNTILTYPVEYAVSAARLYGEGQWNSNMQEQLHITGDNYVSSYPTWSWYWKDDRRWVIHETGTGIDPYPKIPYYKSNHTNIWNQSIELQSAGCAMHPNKQFLYIFTTKYLYKYDTLNDQFYIIDTTITQQYAFIHTIVAPNGNIYLYGNETGSRERLNYPIFDSKTEQFYSNISSKEVVIVEEDLLLKYRYEDYYSNLFTSVVKCKSNVLIRMDYSPMTDDMDTHGIIYGEAHLFQIGISYLITNKIAISFLPLQNKNIVASDNYALSMLYIFNEYTDIAHNYSFTVYININGDIIIRQMKLSFETIVLCDHNGNYCNNENQINIFPSVLSSDVYNILMEIQLNDSAGIDDFLLLGDKVNLQMTIECIVDFFPLNNLSINVGDKIAINGNYMFNDECNNSESESESEIAEFSFVSYELSIKKKIIFQGYECYKICDIEFATCAECDAGLTPIIYNNVSQIQLAHKHKWYNIDIRVLNGIVSQIPLSINIKINACEIGKGLVFDSSIVECKTCQINQFKVISGFYSCYDC